MTDTTTSQKRCTRCSKAKLADQFMRDRSNKSGLSAWCKVCWKEFRASLDYDVDPSVREKRCSRCKLVQLADQFSAYRKSKDGLGSWCKSCASERNRERSRTLNYDVDPTIHEKRCNRCEETKPVDQFDRNRRKADGLQNRCRACMKEINGDWYARNKDRSAELSRAWAVAHPEKVRAIARKRLLKDYGLTPTDYDEMLAAQDSRCAGCDEVFEETPHVDHDHDTGEVRGLLCGSCNKTLGMALESPQRLLGLVRYLHRKSRLRLVASSD